MTRRWIVDHLGEPAFERLASELSGSQLAAVLLEVMERRARARSTADVLAQYQRDPFCQPAVIVLASGGIEARDHAFTAATVERHIGTMLGALDRLERHGYAFGARQVDLLASAERAALADRIADALTAGALAGTTGRLERKPLDHGYYSGGMRYMVWVTAPEGDRVPLIDGGAFDWVARITSNRRAVYVASGAGAQLIPFRFRARQRTGRPVAGAVGRARKCWPGQSHGCDACDACRATGPGDRAGRPMPAARVCGGSASQSGMRRFLWAAPP